MRHGILFIFLFIITLSLPMSASAQQYYQVVDLGTFFPFSIMNSGQMAGSILTTAQFAARGTVGAIQNLGVEGVAISQNPSGLTVGYSGCFDVGCINQEATLWDSAGHLSLLGLLPGGSASAATSINNAGTIVGYGDGADLIIHALRWKGTSMQVLPSLGGDVSSASAINAKGSIAGTSQTPQGYDHAVLWDSAGSIYDLGTLGGSMSFAFGMNNAGIVVGFSYTAAGPIKAFRYVPGEGMQTLPNPSGMLSCIAEGINQPGVIVGDCDPNLGYPTSRAVLWTGGVAYDLNTLLVNGDGWVLEGANAISDNGIIVGMGTYQGQRRGVLLTPHEAVAEGLMKATQFVQEAFDIAGGKGQGR